MWPAGRSFFAHPWPIVSLQVHIDNSTVSEKANLYKCITIMVIILYDILYHVSQQTTDMEATWEDEKVFLFINVFILNSLNTVAPST